MEYDPVSSEPLLGGEVDARTTPPRQRPLPTSSQLPEASVLRRPKEPPPPEAFEDLEDLQLKERKKAEKRVIVEESSEEESSEGEAAPARPRPVEPPPPETYSPSKGKGKEHGVKSYLPPPPPLPPPRPAKIVTSTVPRGLLQVRMGRVVGVGPGTGADKAHISTTTTGSVYLKWELVLGGGQPQEGEEGMDGEKVLLTPVVRMGGRSPVYKDVVMSDWAVPEPPPQGGDDGHTVVFSYSDGCQSTQVPDALPEEDKAKLPPLLFYSVWHTGLGFLKKSEELVAEGVVPASSFFVLGTGKWRDVCLPLVRPGGSVSLDSTPTAYMLGRVHFTPSKAGMLGMTMHDARNLRDLEKFGGGAMDVYARLQVGDWRGGKKAPPGLPDPATSTVIVEGGTNPNFGDQELFMWIDSGVYTSRQPLVVSMYDENKMSRDTLLGKKLLDLTDLAGDTKQHSDLYQLYDDKAKPAGEMALTRTWYPAGQLCVKVVAARNLEATDGLWGSDPFVKLKLEGRVRSYEVTTGTAHKAGSDPAFLESFVFDVVDQCELRVEVWDKDKFTRNDLVGEVIVDLGSVFKEGVKDGWVSLKRRGDWGGYEDKGEIRLECDFAGPPGVSYPMLRPDKTAHDDSGRFARGGLSAEQELAEEAQRVAKELETKQEREAALRELAGEDFTDADIEAAFAQADLDGNLVLTGGELRHLLVCMGELITPGEVDEMIAMCDNDGDGTVAFYEFYQMARTTVATMSDKAWRPGAEKGFRAAVNGPAIKPPPIIIYGPNGQPLQVVDPSADADSRRKAMMRAQDLTKKAEKKMLCDSVCRQYNLRLPELQRVFRRFTGMPCFESGAATLPELLQAFDVDPDPVNPADALLLEKWKEMYAVFVRPRLGKVFVRELLMAMNNFTGATKNQRVNFAFFLFDADNSGTLSQDELIEVLRANHLAADEESVRKKAETIMAAADRDANKTISLEEFVVVAARFPNVLFPNFAVSTQEAMGEVVGVSAPGNKAIVKEEAGKATDEQAEAYLGKNLIK